MNKWITKTLLVAFLGFFTYNAMSQGIIVEKSNDIQTIDGKTYYMHKVQKKETLFSIAKEYNVTVPEIEAVNIEELKDGLKAKAVIKIPYEKNYVYHYVQKKETLYAISKKYDVEQEKIIDANPILIKGLKYGQVIKIPLPEGQAKPSTSKDTIEQTTTAKDTVVKEDTIKPSNKYIRQTINCDNARKKEVYKVGFMIPFYTDEMHKTIPKDDEHKSKTYKSFTFLPFYEAAKIAIDSMKKTNQQFEFFVYDLDNDTAKIKEIFAKPEIKQLDLIIGPFYPNAVKYAAEFLKDTETKIISPLAPETTALQGNPNVIQIRPSKTEHLNQLIYFAAENYKNENIVFVHDGKPNSTKIFDSIKSCIDDTLNYTKFNGIDFKEVVFNNFFKEDELDNNHPVVKSIQPIVKELVTNKRNVIIALIKEKNYAIDFINKLNLLHDSLKSKTILIGLPTWKNIEELDYAKFQNLRTQMSTTCFVDYKNQKTIDFVKEYRSKYKTEPNEYAFIGYDITTYFLNALLKYGIDFDKCFNNMDSELLSTSFKFQTCGHNGWENKFITIFTYENFEMVDVRESNKIKQILENLKIDEEVKE